jgi:phosphoribosylanthranilate isomerase
VVVEIKFCGMTRPEDVKEGATLGADYVGVILASGPRKLDVPRASSVLEHARAPVRRVGVFGDVGADEIARSAVQLGLDAVQLHGRSDAKTLAEIREDFGGELWAVLRLADGTIPSGVGELFDLADVVVLDALVKGALGGTGVTLPWNELAASLAPWRRRARLALAGGLRPENVAQAIRLLRPDIVDVSSGVEAAPGIKDHQRMRAFRDAVRDIK